MSYVKDMAMLARAISHPIALPQTELQLGQSALVSTLRLERGQTADLTWLSFQVHNIVPSQRSSRMLYSQQALNVVTASEPFFMLEDVGSVIRWVSGEDDVITQYVSSTVVYVQKSRTLAANYFQLTGSAGKPVNSCLGQAYVGVYADSFYLTGRHTGNPIFQLSLDVPGSTSLAARARRTFVGPDTLTVMAANNTTNVLSMEVVVTGAFRVFS